MTLNGQPHPDSDIINYPIEFIWAGLHYHSVLNVAFVTVGQGCRSKVKVTRSRNVISMLLYLENSHVKSIWFMVWRHGMTSWRHDLAVWRCDVTWHQIINFGAKGLWNLLRWRCVNAQAFSCSHAINQWFILIKNKSGGKCKSVEPTCCYYLPHQRLRS